MVLSLKPFGCMPSTQSDGAQSAVINHYKDMIYLPIETSGEGEINAHSRVQMALGEAKVKAKQEFERVLEETGVTLEDARAYADEHPELKRPLYKVPALQGHRRHRRELRAPRRGAQGRRGVRLEEARGRWGRSLMADPRLYIGLDVGSTTVKAVVVDPATDEILWQDYQRHDTKQPEKCLEFLTMIETDFPIPHDEIRMFITGSGGSGIAPRIGAKFVQEVNAVSLAVEKLYPACGSVIELGGQDAKIIIFKEDPETGKKKKIPSMNDKCAGGTGAVIDKINAKLHIPPEQLCDMGYTGIKLHPVAGKCGVFAETDINGLQKMGVPPDELMASLFDAIISQNLSVLTRGNTLLPEVLLLGGPNTLHPGHARGWRDNIPPIWEERGTPLPEGVDPRDLIKVPENAQYFAALGAVEFGMSEGPDVGVYRGTKLLRHYIDVGRVEEKAASGSKGLSETQEELDAFKERYKIQKFTPVEFEPGQVVEAFVGLDGGSTSTKAVLLDKDRNVLVKSYQLSKGNPIEDTQEVLGELEQHVQDQGATLKVLGIGTTGYAKDILKDTLRRRRGAGRDRRPHRVGAALLRRRRRASATSAARTSSSSS